MRAKTWAAAATGVLAVIAAISTMVVTSGAAQQAAAPAQPSVTSATVERRTVSAMVAESGILTYRARSDGSPFTVVNQARGTYTWLPAVGQVVAAGHVVYRVNNRAVVLLHGSIPAYRTLSAGATGPDVAQLNADLVALGYATSAQLSPRSASFGSATATAVEKLQAALGVARTGTLARGQAVFQPTAVRVTAVTSQLGVNAQPGAMVLQATSTTRQVQVALDASQQAEVALGDKVTITLPNNHTTPGVVTSVATVATCPSSSGSGAPVSSSAAPGTDSCASGGSGSSTPTIAVNVAFSHPASGGKWDQAPVQVGITTARVRNALTVPVAALLARSGGGYAVEVVGTGTSAANHLVQVSLGVFDDAGGLVQVSSSGLAAGQKVVVPST